MKRTSIALFACALSAACFAASPAPSAKQSTPIIGDYVEARTASVFAGACHYNGELMVTGRDAVMAWNIKSGSWKGVDLTGVRAAAAVSSDANLSDATAPRSYELVVDSSATATQATAMADLVAARCGTSLGTLSSLRRAAVTFTHDAEHYEFAAPGFAAASVDAMPNHECCKQPELVWYTPLSPVPDRKVGFTLNAQYTGHLTDAWKRGEENSAFYGTFTAN